MSNQENFGKLMVMLDMQNKTNLKVHPQWVDQGFRWLRAVLVEGVEGLEHVGWKWWKKQSADMDQVRMELVDIFHFAMSDRLLKSGGDLEAAARHIDAEMARGTVDISVSIMSGELVHNHKMGNEDIRDRMEAMVGLAACGFFSFSLFAALLKDADMTMDDLFKQYVAKNVLNFFRQDNGYKEGTYRKVWNGREDNEHLVELMADVDFSRSTARDVLYVMLEKRYATTA